MYSLNITKMILVADVKINKISVYRSAFTVGEYE